LYSPKTTDTSRTIATEILIQVLGQGQSLTAALPQHVERLGDPRERALAKALCFGVLRWLPRLEALISSLVKKPPQGKDLDLRIVLLLGLYQLIYTRQPPHAAVSETVAIAQSRGKPWAKALINGVLRNFQRQREKLFREIDQKPHVALAHPRWLVARIRDAYPKDWQNILAENNRQAPMTLRVNTQHMSRDQYLHDHPQSASPVAHTRSGIQLDQAEDIHQVPGFAKGLVSVQDGAAQLATELLALGPGQRVLDACAAPGGKTAHILESEPGLTALTAVEQDPLRLIRLEETLKRLELSADLRCADATAPDTWWDGQPFQRILLDVPCSGSGIIRHHPDIKFHRRPNDIPRLVASQARILRALWPLLAPGGLLLYVTCSVLPEENQQQIQKFLAEHPDAREKPIDAPWGRWITKGGKRQPGRQILPGEDDMDGFFYARIEKAA